MLKLRRHLIACSVMSVLATLAGAGAARASSVLPYMGPSPSPSIFGINTGTYDSNQAYFKRDLPTARSMGARWATFTNDSIHFSRSGKANYSVLDYEVKQSKKLGMGVLVTLGGSPSSCSASPRPHDFTGCPPTTSKNLRAYRSFLSAELLRYHNVVRYWESWIEPNGRSYWITGPNPQQYATLLQTQYQVFQQFNRAHHTSMKLLFGGPISFSTLPANGMAVLPFANVVLDDLHGARAFDAIGLHAYRFPSSNTGPADLNWGPSAMDYDYVGGIPNASGAAGPFPQYGCGVTYSGFCQMTWPQELSAYEQVFANHGYGQIPLWLTQFGWPGNANPIDALYPSFDTQAQYLTQAYNDILQLPFIQAAFWFNLRDYQPGLPNPDPAFFAHYGLLGYRFCAKSAAGAFERVAKPQASPPGPGC